MAVLLNTISCWFNLNSCLVISEASVSLCFIIETHDAKVSNKQVCLSFKLICVCSFQTVSPEMTMQASAVNLWNASFVSACFHSVLCVNNQPFHSATWATYTLQRFRNDKHTGVNVLFHVNMLNRSNSWNCDSWLSSSCKQETLRLSVCLMLAVFDQSNICNHYISSTIFVKFYCFQQRQHVLFPLYAV